jgi:hypothetical protein
MLSAVLFCCCGGDTVYCSMLSAVLLCSGTLLV